MSKSTEVVFRNKAGELMVARPLAISEHDILKLTRRVSRLEGSCALLGLGMGMLAWVVIDLCKGSVEKSKIKEVQEKG